MSELVKRTYLTCARCGRRAFRTQYGIDCLPCDYGSTWSEILDKEANWFAPETIAHWGTTVYGDSLITIGDASLFITSEYANLLNSTGEVFAVRHYDGKISTLEQYLSTLQEAVALLNDHAIELRRQSASVK
jgi:ribosomal protein L37E